MWEQYGNNQKVHKGCLYKSSERNPHSVMQSNKVVQLTLLV